MVIILSSQGKLEVPQYLEGNHKSSDESLEFKGYLGDFRRDDDGKILSRVELIVLDHAHMVKRIRSCSSFPWITRVQEPSTFLRLVSGYAGEDNDIPNMYFVLDASGESLRYHQPSKYTKYDAGYGAFLKGEAKFEGFELQEDIIDKIFNPIEEELKQYFFPTNK